MPVTYLGYYKQWFHYFFSDLLRFGIPQVLGLLLALTILILQLHWHLIPSALSLRAYESILWPYATVLICILGLSAIRAPVAVDNQRDIQAQKAYKDHLGEVAGHLKEIGLLNGEIGTLRDAARVEAERRMVKPSLPLGPDSQEGPIPIRMNWHQGGGVGTGPVVVTRMRLAMENEGESTIKVIAFRLFRMDQPSSNAERIEHSAKVSTGNTTSVDVTENLMRAISGSSSTLPDFFAVRGNYRIGLVLEYKLDSKCLETQPEEVYVQVKSQATQSLSVSAFYERPNS